MNTTKPARPAFALFNFAWALLAITIQTLAALALDSWLSIALWVLAARNVLWLVMAVYGLSMLASERLNDHEGA